MTPRRTLRLFFGTAALAGLVALGTPAASASGGNDGTTCFKVKGKQDVSFTIDGCNSVVGFCTAGAIKRGILKGDTTFEATGLGGGVLGEESVVTPPAEPGTTWTYSGNLNITGKHGSVSVMDIGVYDTVNGSFTEQGRIQGGDGAFEGATGTIFIFGFVTADGTGFTGKVRGEVCVPNGDDDDGDSDSDSDSD